MTREETIAVVRKKFIGLNKLHRDIRIERGKPVEQWIRETKNIHTQYYKGHALNWEGTTLRQDKDEHKDAKAKLPDNTWIYSQLKWRQPDSGSDVGVAMIEPYPGSLKQLRQDYKTTKKIPRARDCQFNGQFYDCLENTWDTLYTVPYGIVKELCQSVFLEWWQSGEELNENNRTFYSTKVPGAQFRWKRDAGTGWHGDVEKILCYLTPASFINKAGVITVKMIVPPQYLIEAKGAKL